ncbi:MAG: ATP-binding protein, partial [Atopobiaceae bacterium]|nr:ATP-binding protein [Atopobiaceae bacterium]
KNEGITQSFANYNVKHALELLEEQMKRMEESTALGMWEFAAYVLSEDANTANNVAHTYLALTQGERSYMSRSAVNLWRGDPATSEEGKRASEICSYLRDLRHPIFGLNLNITEAEPYFNVYPAAVTATTSLTGKELAYALNFPKKSLPGLPVLSCAEFGRNVVTYEPLKRGEQLFKLGKIFHMHSMERVNVCLTRNSLASHTFVTGSTGSGKSNTVCQILSEAEKSGVGFLVIEPAKGEYKDILGMRDGVEVFGTNPKYTPLLKLNPFSFPEGVHVLEHLDRLVEIFNVCWPMYAAMPAVLKGAVERSYADCGWDLQESTNPYGEGMWPNFADVARNVKIAINESEYDAENKGAYKGSLLTRLESLTNGINGMVFSVDEVPANILFDGKTIVDLSRVGSSETKSLIMGMLVLKLQEHRMTTCDGPNSDLRHLTVLEEAHNLLKRTSTDQPVEGGNLLGKSVEMIANSIAEMRTYGEGFVIADQAPGLLDMAAIRNTNTKIIMRLPDLTDRELVGKAANLDDDQITELAKLPRGVAAVYQNEWIQPVLCMVDRFDSETERFAYREPEPTSPEERPSDAVEIAEMISSGVRVDDEVLVSDVKPKLRGMGVDASVQVTIMRLLANPPEEPRMTKIAPVMSALFPSVKDAIVEAYAKADDPRKWTESAERALVAWTNRQVADSVRRDIVQGLITDYVLNELGRLDELRRWSVEGGLR